MRLVCRLKLLSFPIKLYVQYDMYKHRVIGRSKRRSASSQIAVLMVMVWSWWWWRVYVKAFSSDIFYKKKTTHLLRILDWNVLPTTQNHSARFITYTDSHAKTISAIDTQFMCVFSNDLHLNHKKNTHLYGCVCRQKPFCMLSFTHSIRAIKWKRTNPYAIIIIHIRGACF